MGATPVTRIWDFKARLLLHCSESDDWTPGYPEAILLHKFEGSWKKDDQQPQAPSEATEQNPSPDEEPLYR